MVVAKDPRELAVDEITNILNINKYPYDFIELRQDSRHCDNLDYDVI